ncbi:MAG: polymer-forming cytoskeletal protein [candidate division WOR-3 bacterium]
MRPLLLLAALVGPGFAAQFVSGSSLTVPPGETRIGDIYFAGTVLRLEGRLDGSIIAGAQSVTVSGPVTRNLFLAAQSVDISGPVTGDVVAVSATFNLRGRVNGAVRVGSGTVYVNGEVGQDVLAGCANMMVAPQTEIRGDVAATCRSLELAGTVRGDVRATADRIVISGSIDGDVDVIVGKQLTLTPDARVYGNLRYRSNKKLNLSNPDLVFGDIEYVQLPGPDELEEVKALRPKPGAIAAFLLPFALLSMLGAIVVALILIAVWKYPLNEALNRAISHWGRTLGLGSVGFLIGPMTILVSLALIVTIPAGLIAAAAYVVLVYLGKTLSGMFLGKLLFRICGAPDISLWLAAPVGIVIVYALCAIPFAGWVIWLVTLALGFGIAGELLGMSRSG